MVIVIRPCNPRIAQLKPLGSPVLSEKMEYCTTFFSYMCTCIVKCMHSVNCHSGRALHLSVWDFTHWVCHFVRITGDENNHNMGIRMALKFKLLARANKIPMTTDVHSVRYGCDTVVNVKYRPMCVGFCCKRTVGWQ